MSEHTERRDSRVVHFSSCVEMVSSLLHEVQSNVMMATPAVVMVVVILDVIMKRCTIATQVSTVNMISQQTVVKLWETLVLLVEQMELVLVDVQRVQTRRMLYAKMIANAQMVPVTLSPIPPV